VRLPSVLYGLAGVLAIMLFVARWRALPDALLAAVLMLASYQYVGAARLGRVDMTLTFFETAALLSFLAWLSRRAAAADATAPPAHWWTRPAVAHYLFATALALAVLAKGPIGLLLPGLAIAIFLGWEGRWREARALAAPGPIVLLLALGSVWYVACSFRHADILDRQLADENLGRFFGRLGTMSPWYYAGPLITASLPLSLLAPLAVVAALRAPRVVTPQQQRARDPVRLLAIFWCVTVLVLSLSAYKRRSYLLPLVPASAVLVVHWLGTRPAPRGRQLRAAVLAACGIMIVVNQVYLRHTDRVAAARTHWRQAGAAIGAVVPRQSALYSSGFGLPAIAPLLFYLDRSVPALPADRPHTAPGYVLVAAGDCHNAPAAAALVTRLCVDLSTGLAARLESRPPP
jgi:4-amino-4-deoxy-L-arabinose transferase-like glycosyltransferase